MFHLSLCLFIYIYIGEESISVFLSNLTLSYTSLSFSFSHPPSRSLSHPGAFKNSHSRRDDPPGQQLVINNWEVLSSKITDDIKDLTMLKHSTYYHIFSQKILKILNNLNKIINIINLFIKIQKLWLYLSNIMKTYSDPSSSDSLVQCPSSHTQHGLRNGGKSISNRNNNHNNHNNNGKNGYDRVETDVAVGMREQKQRFNNFNKEYTNLLEEIYSKPLLETWTSGPPGHK